MIQVTVLNEIDLINVSPFDSVNQHTTNYLVYSLNYCRSNKGYRPHFIYFYPQKRVFLSDQYPNPEAMT